MDMTFISPAIEAGTPSSQARRSFMEYVVSYGFARMEKL
jgi:hypothetical protein